MVIILLMEEGHLRGVAALTALLAAVAARHAQRGPQNIRAQAKSNISSRLPYLDG